MLPNSPPKIAVILVNLGTPDAPTVPAVRRYLKQFLSDSRVVEIPKVLWAIILNLFVLPFRPKRVAHAYASVWQNDSPLRQITLEQVALLQQRFDSTPLVNPKSDVPNCQIQVYAGMTDGNPSLVSVLDELRVQKVDNVVILPMYPQFSGSTTAAVFDVLARWGMGQRNLPSISFVKDYFAHPLYIQALADSVRAFQSQHGKPDKLLFSFHGIPEPYEAKGDPYARRCRCTAAQVAQALGLQADEWLCSFQSRFGKQEWVKPYTDRTLVAWGSEGVKSVQVISPSFAADCLETLEELTVENRDNFLNAGGESYHYIPALNASPAHVELLFQLTAPLVTGWQATLRGW